MIDNIQRVSKKEMKVLAAQSYQLVKDKLSKKKK